MDEQTATTEGMPEPQAPSTGEDEGATTQPPPNTAPPTTPATDGD